MGGDANTIWHCHRAVAIDDDYELAETLLFKAKCGHDKVWIVASGMGQAVEMAEENWKDRTDYYDVEYVSLEGAALIMSRPSDNEEL